MCLLRMLGSETMIAVLHDLDREISAAFGIIPAACLRAITIKSASLSTDNLDLRYMD